MTHLLQNQATGAVLTLLLYLLFFKDIKAFAGEIWAVYFLLFEDITKFISGETLSIPNYRCLTQGHCFKVIVIAKMKTPEHKLNGRCPYFYILVDSIIRELYDELRR